MPVPKKTKEKKNITKEIYLDKMQISKQDGNDFSLFVQLSWFKETEKCIQ